MVRPIPSIALAITTISFFIRIIYPNSNTKNILNLMTQPEKRTN